KLLLARRGLRGRKLSSTTPRRFCPLQHAPPCNQQADRRGIHSRLAPPAHSDRKFRSTSLQSCRVPQILTPPELAVADLASSESLRPAVPLRRPPIPDNVHRVSVPGPGLALLRPECRAAR